MLTICPLETSYVLFASRRFWNCSKLYSSDVQTLQWNTLSWFQIWELKWRCAFWTCEIIIFCFWYLISFLILRLKRSYGILQHLNLAVYIIFRREVIDWLIWMRSIKNLSRLRFQSCSYWILRLLCSSICFFWCSDVTRIAHAIERVWERRAKRIVPSYAEMGLEI